MTTVITDAPRRVIEEIAGFLEDTAATLRREAQGLIGGQHNRMLAEADDCDRWRAVLVAASPSPSERREEIVRLARDIFLKHASGPRYYAPREIVTASEELADAILTLGLPAPAPTPSERNLESLGHALGEVLVHVGMIRADHEGLTGPELLYHAKLFCEAPAPAPAPVSLGWACAARRQSLPEPAECDWPVCGCDPAANKVIEALEEGGMLPSPPGAADLKAERPPIYGSAEEAEHREGLTAPSPDQPSEEIEN